MCSYLRVPCVSTRPHTHTHKSVASPRASRSADTVASGGRCAPLPPCAPVCVFCGCGSREGGGRGEEEEGGMAVDVQMCIMLKGCEWGGVT